MVCSAGGVGLQLLAEKLIDAKRRAVVRPHNGRIARNGQLAPPTPRPTDKPALRRGRSLPACSAALHPRA
jgi:hypothetical protein